MSRQTLVSASMLAALLSAPLSSRAQDAAAKQYVDVKIAEPPKQGGLEITMKNGATFSLVDTRDVVGVTPNGSTLTVGLKFDGVATYRNGGHEWRTVLGINEALTKTPALEEPVKSADAFNVESTYLYFVRPWFGPFARFTVGTPLFRGFDVRPTDTTYTIARVAGTTDTVTSRRLTLTEPFRPLTLKETIGPFARPVSGDRFNLETRIGLGGLQTFADGQLILKDDAATADRVEVQELRDVLQVGVEGSLEMWGSFQAKKISYKIGVGALIPAWNNDMPAAGEAKKNPLQLTNLDIGAAISFKVVEWATLDYEIKLVRQPQLTDQWQIRNGMMLTLGLGYSRKPPEPPAPPAKPAPDAPAPAAPAPAAPAPAPAPVTK
ncbi:hypothetical protein [Polyangium sp. 15x6]|uniref:hypothetical protein n=1 Tax=Polyangium sp. 15x6 TaxID=3042687 RepID=UPI00249BF396|nr:hypothetical protein [Polyangium sp. 15x6]MDI3288899.1 hypothetical protein [Polyangium sp. 15x6]